MSLLTIKNLSISYKDTLILNDINLNLKKGEILGIAGQSGSGKSTLLKSILNLLPNDFEKIHGNILYDNQSLYDLSTKEIINWRSKHFGFISQNANTAFCPVITIGKQILQILKAKQAINSNDTKKQLLELFIRLGFDDADKIFHSYPFELSGGMNQRINIALNLLTKTNILLADEPTSALDIHTQKIVLEELSSLAKNCGISIILVSHNLNTLKEIADNIAILYQGKIIEYASCENIFNKPQQAYTQQLISAASLSTI